MKGGGMSFLMGRTLVLVVGISLLTSVRPAAGQEQITQSGYPCDKYKGALAVFGSLTANKPGIQLDQAHVKLTRNDGDALIVNVEKDGRYCIRYSKGPDIVRLSFEAGETTCVEQISGSFSHYINKVLDNKCALLQASVTLLGPNTTGLILTSAAAKKFWVVQAVLSNTSGGPLQVVSFQFEHQTSKQGQFASASDVIVPVDPEIVELLAARQKSSVCLLCVGPVTLFQIAHHAHAGDAEAYIRSHALRVNDIIPDGRSAARLIFVDKFKMPADAPQPGALGTLVIRATKWTKAGDSTLSTAISAENSVGRIAQPGSEQDSENAITTVVQVN
jgi:hypothetical protein